MTSYVMNDLMCGRQWGAMKEKPKWAMQSVVDIDEWSRRGAVNLMMNENDLLSPFAGTLTAQF